MKKFLKSYWFILSMLVAIIAGCITGAVWPGATSLEPLGTVFINMMFCVVVPMVFVSISSAIANMASPKRAGKIMGVTVLTFMVTAAIAALMMYIVVRIVPIVTGQYSEVSGEVGSVSAADMIVNFFTVPDFTDLWSRKAMLPLIVAAVIFGFGVQLSGGSQTPVAKLLSNLTDCIMKVVKLITYYAPIGFFGFFAYLVATYGPQLIGDYSRTLLVYYVLCFVYMFIAFPGLCALWRRQGRRKGDVQASVLSCRDGVWHVLVRGDDPHQRRGGAGDGHFQGRFRYRAAHGRDDAHGRIGHVGHHQGGVPLWDFRY